MSGYFEPRNKEAIAISYLENPSADTSLSYFYLTRRPYEYELSQDHNLICIGGPGFDIEDTRSYRRDHEFPEDIVREIDRFVKNTYDTDPNKTIDYKFTWHGLMGYTTNGVRMIGTEPSNPRLLYNLGCNGIGILPSVYGGKRIAQLINKEKLEASIFDVPTQTSLS
jgi:glycine/D-amino acid oxidase-like deaminating enzyme